MDESIRKDLDRWLMDVASRQNWDTKPLSLAFELRQFLESIKDEGTSIDFGTDGITGDLWVTVSDIEWFISIRKSNNQMKEEEIGKIPRSATKY